ncbi:MAG: hypothetical protein GKR93_18905 [Gammaproteobacteria bacterium]|nr:hypothetical protein [Gammaproteobacteria bacterium]
MSELSRLRWRCRRGIKEMDLVFEHFLEQEYAELSSVQKHLFSQILEESDLDIMDWILGRKEPLKAEYNVLIQQFRKLNAN